jgi:16S rRNA (uracil1498-N3)-methyltransferase
MSDIRHAPRVFLDADVRAGEAISVSSDQAHYLQHVMRLKCGDALRVFNGRDGEWQAAIGMISKRGVEIVPGASLKPQAAEPDLELCCAPIKKAHFDFLIEKATELGVSAIRPVLTARAQVREVNTERLRALAIEAAEQSERMSIPVIHKPVTLTQLIAQWPPGRLPVVCAEWGEAAPIKKALEAAAGGTSKASIITGPEGGFEADEMEVLRAFKNAVFVRLGPRILRADTAAIAALSCWQAMCGDWLQS